MGPKPLKGIHNKVVEGLSSTIVLEKDQNLGKLLRSLTSNIVEDYTRNMKRNFTETIRTRFPAQDKISDNKLISILLQKIPPTYGKCDIPSHAIEKHKKSVYERHFTLEREFLGILIKL